MNILVSGCLLGLRCRYDGKSKSNSDVIDLMDKYNLIPVCPEVLGGLPTPRPASEIKGDKVLSTQGDDYTDKFNRGAEESLRLIKLYNIDMAILKENSPSCGYGKIYDGSFSNKLIDGNGITARLLEKNNIKIIGESQIKDMDRG